MQPNPNASNTDQIATHGVKKRRFLDGVPWWFILMNVLMLSPILAWPLVYFGSIFMFDNPKNQNIAWLFFILINAYPIYLIAYALIVLTSYPKNKKLALGLYCGQLAIYLFCIGYLYYFISTNQLAGGGY